MAYHTAEPWSPTIRQVVDESHALSRRKGWYEGYEPGDFSRVPEKLALIHSEISEALEAYRDNPRHFAKPCVAAQGKPEGFDIELADAVIRIADLCGWLGIDLGRAIMLKHAYNETRPHRHGGKAC